MPDTIAALSTALEGRYAIERELGAGGMATVYLAHDLKHDRRVAIKVLKPELAAAVGSERFLAEIRTTAHLQHPNILPLHDSGEADGVLFYVMPYVEGESLRKQLDRERQLPVEEAVRIATEVAEALQAAHEEGVIHRDIKPANILMSRGKPLVADFGIALAVSAAGGDRLTGTGLTPGTPHYMSPEQAGADEGVSAASDVYSLGCVLYEMLLGEPPFTGPTGQAVLAKMLTGEVPHPRAQRKTIPPNVDAVIRRALERLPADRFANARDFARALGNPGYRYELEGAVGGASGAGTPWKVSTAGLALLAAALAVWGVRRNRGDTSGMSRERVVLFDWDALDSAGAISGSVRYGVGIAPDGKALALRDIRTDRILLKEDPTLDPVPIGGTEGGFGPVFSPDGRWIAFFSSVDNTLRKVPRGGGSPVTLAGDIAVREQQMAWLDDGRIVFTALGWSLDAVSEDGGPVERIVDIARTGRFVTGVTALPGSPGVLLSTCDNACPNPEVRVLDFRNGETRTLIPGATGAWYLRSGHILFARADGSVFFAPFDLDRLAVTGPETPILESVATTPRRADLTATWDGTVVYLPGAGTELGGGVEPVWVELDGTATPVQKGWTGTIADPVLSPDNRFLAFSEGSGDGAEIGVKELPDGPITWLTTDKVQDWRPLWTPDGRSVAFESSSTDTTGHDVFKVRRRDGSTEATTFLDVGRSLFQVAISPDGRWLVYRVGDVNANDADLFVMDLRGDSVGRPLLTGDFNEKTATFSPDGRWLAYVSNESGMDQVVVRPFPDVDVAQYPISVGGGITPLWAPDGSALYFDVPGGDRIVEARLAFDQGLRVVERRKLFSTIDYVGNGTHWYYDLNRDGRRFLMLRSSTDSLRRLGDGARAHVLVRNLLAEIRER